MCGGSSVCFLFYLLIPIAEKTRGASASGGRGIGIGPYKIRC